MKPAAKFLMTPRLHLLPLALSTALTLAAPGLSAHEDEKPKVEADANAAAATFVCPMHPDVTDSKASNCPRCGMKLTADTSHAHAGSAAKGHDAHNDHAATPASVQPTIRAELSAATPPAVGQEARMTLRLFKPDNRPVTFKDLEAAHTKRIHLLVVDASLGDYTHEHPEETKTPGEFAFSFKPRAGGLYTVWADLVPTATGTQEYARTGVTVAGPSKPLQPVVNTTTTVAGYRFDLSTEHDEKLAVGRATLVKVRVTRPDGQPATNLEPVMGAFAHGVGFPGDLSGVTHVHPMGVEPEKDTERGGPELSFHLLPEKLGFMKFYVQVQLDGKDVYAGFGLNVGPAGGETAGN